MKTDRQAKAPEPPAELEVLTRQQDAMEKKYWLGLEDLQSSVPRNPSPRHARQCQQGNWIAVDFSV